MDRRIMNVLVAGAVVGLAGAAVAAPRDVLNLATAFSDVGAAGSASSTASLPVAGSYPVKYVRIQGTLSPVIAGTYASEAQVLIDPPGAGVAPVAFAASGDNALPTPKAIDLFLRVPASVPNAAGAWAFAFRESFDDGAGADARWDNVKITLNDGEPAATDLGTLSPGAQRPTVGLLAGTVTWIKFTVPYTVNSGSGTYLDIDTNASTISGGTFANDTYAVLFSDDGRVLAFDDDSGVGNASQLSFGAGTRPGTADALNYAGQNGNLPAGTYYLAIKGYQGSEGQEVGWGLTGSPSAHAGLLRVTFNTNAGSTVYCPADFNRRDGVDLIDIFDFLTSWFSGCP